MTIKKAWLNECMYVYELNECMYVYEYTKLLQKYLKDADFTCKPLQMLANLFNYDKSKF